MFEWASIISGLVKFINTISQWLREKELVQTGKALEKGEQDAKTLDAVQNANNARRDADHTQLDSELRLD